MADQPPKLSPGENGEWVPQPLSQEALDYDRYLINTFMPLSQEWALAMTARKKKMNECNPEELPEYLVNEPSRYYQTQLLGLPYSNEAESEYQWRRGELVAAFDEALSDLELYSPGFDYRSIFHQVLDQLFTEDQLIAHEERLRDRMIDLYPQQLMMVMDYFASFTTGVKLWDHEPDEADALSRQKACAKELKEAFEHLLITIPELQRRMERRAYGPTESKYLRDMLEEFDVSRWNFAQEALEYIKGQIYESVLTEVTRMEPSYDPNGEAS